MARKYYLDVLRILACVAVIAFHITGIWNGRAALLYKNMLLFHVPVFVMISGSLFLNPDHESSLSTLYKKNILKLLVIYFVWSGIYLLQSRPQWNGLQELAQLLVRGHFHLWYIPMLLGLYMIVPCVRSIVKNLNGLFYFLGLLLLFNLGGDLVQRIPSLQFVSEFIGNIGKQSLSFCSGWILYFVLGYALDNYSGTKCKVPLYVGAVIFQLLTAVLVICSREIEFLTSNFSISRVTVAAAVFLAVRDLLKDRTLSLTASKNVRIFSDLTLGIYLIHPLFIYLVRPAMEQENPLYAVPLGTMVVFLLSAVSVWVLKHIPVVKKWLV